MDDTDLSGLDLAGAKAYLLDFATAARLARKELEEIESELELWTRRVGLAETKGMADLAAAARSKVAEIEAKRVSAAAELSDIEGKVRRIREKLPLVAAKERSIDADRLLAELQMMTGELFTDSGGEESLEAKMAKLEAEAEASSSSSGAEADLDALKAKLRNEGS